jgi:hypothetical protein
VLVDNVVVQASYVDAFVVAKGTVHLLVIAFMLGLGEMSVEQAAKKIRELIDSI